MFQLLTLATMLRPLLEARVVVRARAEVHLALAAFGVEKRRSPAKAPPLH
jgi:hypothetical protein